MNIGNRFYTWEENEMYSEKEFLLMLEKYKPVISFVAYIQAKSAAEHGYVSAAYSILRNEIMQKNKLNR